MGSEDVSPVNMSSPVPLVESIVNVSFRVGSDSLPYQSRPQSSKILVRGPAARRKRRVVQRVSSMEWEQIGNEIHVWQASLDRAIDAVGRLEPALSPDEKARADRFHFMNDRNRFVVARGVLRELLGRYLQQNPESLAFSYGPHGKPSLSGEYESSG